MDQYDKQAEEFLTKFGVKFTAKLSNSKAPTWGKGKAHGNHFRITLSKRQSNGMHGDECECVDCHPVHRLIFDFWGSIADKEKGITEEKPYSVLACISGDIHCPDTFKDFCAEYGYDEDSIEASKLFLRCYNFSKKLRAFFNAEEISALQEIQ